MRIHIHPQVAEGLVLVVLVHAVHINNLSYDFHGSCDVLSRLRLAVQRDANDDFSTHLAGHVNGEIVLQATIDQHHVAHSHRREGCRDGHGGSYGLRQPSAVEYHLAVVHDVCSHTGERNLQVFVKVERVGVTHKKFLEQLCQVLASDETACTHVTLTNSQTSIK